MASRMLGREDSCGQDCSRCLIPPHLPCGVSSDVEMDTEMDTEMNADMVLFVYVVGIVAII